jgi:pimeloyl-ACP methyl ester carboxylesterase
VLVDLIQIRTRDDIRLDGMFQKPAAGIVSPSLDAVCLVHGTGSNFYSSTLFDVLGASFLDQGCAVLRVNTRGHDGISTAVTSRGGRRLGAAYEVVDECRHDLAGWLDWLRQAGFSRIGVVGHSLGAVKSLHALAQDPDLPVEVLVALSPPRLSYSWFCQSSRAEVFLNTYRQAQELIDQGRPGALLEVTVPLPYAITAAGYVEKYGPDERYNFLNFIASVPCPLLVTFGANEVVDNVAFQGSPEALTQLRKPPPRLTMQVIPGGDHFYSAVRPELTRTLVDWLRSVAS